MSDAKPVESVWDYPRPPRIEPTEEHVVVEWAGRIVADTRRAMRVLETSHPPAYYIPMEDVRRELLTMSSQSSYCEWKGRATYWSLELNSQSKRSANAAWGYENPTGPFAAIRGFVAFYASRVDRCTVDGETVQAQPGDFYGGWITSRVKGPFKGGIGTAGW